MNTLKQSVTNVAVGIAVGTVVALLVLAVNCLVEFPHPKLVWAIVVVALIAGVGGTCVQASLARESVLEELTRKLPRKQVFPILMAISGIPTLVIVFKSERCFDEKLLCTIAVVVVVALCLWFSAVDSQKAREIAAQTEALKLAAQEKMFEMATRAIKDNPEFKESIEELCFKVADVLQGGRKPMRHRLPPPASGELD